MYQYESLLPYIHFYKKGMKVGFLLTSEFMFTILVYNTFRFFVITSFAVYTSLGDVGKLKNARKFHTH